MISFSVACFLSVSFFDLMEFLFWTNAHCTQPMTGIDMNKMPAYFMVKRGNHCARFYLSDIWNLFNAWQRFSSKLIPIIFHIKFGKTKTQLRSPFPAQAKVIVCVFFFHVTFCSFNFQTVLFISNQRVCLFFLCSKDSEFDSHLKGRKAIECLIIINAICVFIVRRRISDSEIGFGRKSSKECSYSYYIQ